MFSYFDSEKISPIWTKHASQILLQDSRPSLQSYSSLGNIAFWISLRIDLLVYREKCQESDRDSNDCQMSDREKISPIWTLPRSTKDNRGEHETVCLQIDASLVYGRNHFFNTRVSTIASILSHKKTTSRYTCITRTCNPPLLGYSHALEYQ